MIPGTLRPLPKKLKEVKQDSETLMKAIEYDFETTQEVYKSSRNFSYEEVKSHYLKNLEHTANIQPLVKELEKLTNKYINDHLLNELVYKLYQRVFLISDKLGKDSHRLDTVLMAKRKQHIESMIPRIKDDMQAKLAFLKDLSFKEILDKSQIYSDSISEISGRINELRDDYEKLISGSFDVTDLYSYLEERIIDIEIEVGEYSLILRTCKMELLKVESGKLIEIGGVINKALDVKQTSEIVIKGNDFVEKSTSRLEEMNTLKITVPRKGYSKDFLKNVKDLDKLFRDNKDKLSKIVQTIKVKTTSLAKKLDRINAIKELSSSDGIKVKNVAKMLKIKKRGTFKLAMSLSNFPQLKLNKEKLVIAPSEDVLTSELFDEIINAIELNDKVSFINDFLNHFKAFSFADFWESVKEFSKKNYQSFKEYSIKAYQGLKKGTNSSISFVKKHSKNIYDKTVTIFNNVKSRIFKEKEKKEGKKTFLPEEIDQIPDEEDED
ncbi:MAG: hypothetical protein KAS95_04085 [Candidatus Heimdallarchaeota archaeon]|nr:hypothetical protein [Candidatus Heimdallarchaeota archaeon]